MRRKELSLNRKAIEADMRAMDKRISALEHVGYHEAAKSVRSDRAHLALLLAITKEETDK